MSNIDIIENVSDQVKEALFILDEIDTKTISRQDALSKISGLIVESYLKGRFDATEEFKR